MDGTQAYDFKNTPEPEVVKAVLKEVKALGDNTKASINEMGRRYEELKGLIDKHGGSLDPCIKAHTDKLTEDITTRQNELDKAATERMDKIEVAMKRSPLSTSTTDPDFMKDAKEFTLIGLSSRGKAPKYDIEEKDIDIEGFKKYQSIYQNYLRKDVKLLSSEEVKEMQVGVDPDGGYTVTPAMSRRIITKIYESDPVQQLAATETISTDALEMRVDRDEADAGWEGETVEGAETETPQIGLLRIPAHTMYARVKVTQKLLEDSSINIESWLAKKIANKFFRVSGAAFVTGDGILKPRGFLAYDDGTSWGQIEQKPSLAAATLTTDGLVDLKYSLREEFLSNAVHLMNRLTVAIVMKLKDGNGDYLWRPGLQQGEPSLLNALPVRMSTTMPTVTASALSVVLADWKEAYQIVNRLGISILKDPYTATPLVKFYTRKRLGGAVVNFDAIKIQDVAAS